MCDKYILKNFDDFIEYRGALEGSGRSRKLWLQHESSDTVGLFKYPKGFATFDYFSEILATDIAQRLGIPTARVDIGYYHGELGSMSYQINKRNEILIEGIYFIANAFPDYDREKLFSESTKEYYSLHMIQKSLSSISESLYLELQSGIINMLIFDFLIGNTDRHQHNWGILASMAEPDTESDSDTVFSPLFDNSSSLCSYINENDITNIIKDKRRFESIVDNKSKSRIRIDGKAAHEPKHYDVIEYIAQTYNVIFSNMSKIVRENINEQELDTILYKYKDIISEQRLILIKKYLLRKVELLTQIELAASFITKK